MIAESRMDRTPLLVFADDWGRHPSSCQHLVRRLAGDFPIIWANTVGTRRIKADSFTLRRGFEKLRNWRRGVKCIGDEMWVVDLPMLPTASEGVSRSLNQWLVTRRLSAVLSQLKLAPPVVLTTLPYLPRLIGGLRRRSLVYYCTDDYSFWPEAERDAMRGAEEELVSQADLVLVVSRALMSRLGHSARCEYLPHGVDVDHFAAASNMAALPAELAALPGRKVGFFGLIYEKLNFQLLATVAKTVPDIRLVMIGPVDYCPDEFKAIPNVVILGPKPYEELPRWLAGLDVLLMPYVDDEMIRQSNPLKLRECLATGKPTVSVDVPEARFMQPHVRIASDGADFVRQVGEALDEPQGAESRKARQAAVANDGWEHRASRLKELLQEVATQCM